MENFATHLFSLSFALFLLMDPIGNIPIYVSTLKEVESKRQHLIIIRELLIALVVIILFAFLGDYLLIILGIDQKTVLISGGIILFLIAIQMIFPKADAPFYASPGVGEPFIVPLAIPLIAGPSVLAAVIVYSHRGSPLLLILAICIAWLITTVILLAAPFLKKILGMRGVTACERLMGLLLTLMSVQMFLEGMVPILSSSQ